MDRATSTLRALGHTTSPSMMSSNRNSRPACQRAWTPGVQRRQLVVHARSPRYDRRRPPPPDLPSLLFDQRIVYLGMPLVPAVTELMIAELLYLEKQGPTLPIEMLINSSGTTRQNGDILGYDSEGVAIASTMGFVKNPISTVNMGLAVGWSCVLLSLGKKGSRKSLPHSLAMIQQPRVPPTGQRQAIEVHIKWREVLDYKRELLRLLSVGTGWGVDKLDYDMQRPLYMRPQEALEYGVIDHIIQPDSVKQAKAVQHWVKSGRAESEGRLEEWYDYLQLQEEHAVKHQYKKVVAQTMRETFRGTAQAQSQADPAAQQANLEGLKQRLAPGMLTEAGEVRLPMSKSGLHMALLNAERYAAKAVERQVKAGRVQLPASLATPPAAPAEPHVDYPSLLSRLEQMSAEEFSAMDVDQLVQQFSRV